MTTITINHAHLFCSSGGAGIGFNMSNPRAGGLHGQWRCLGGIDVDAGRCRDFERFTGAPATQLDLFNRIQYIAHNGHEPPIGWREALPDDIRQAFGHEHPTAVVTSPPCRGFSGLLSASLAKTAKYQALNELTLRGLWLLLEAYADDPVEFIVLENVPLLKHRGQHLLQQIVQLLRRFGYATAETVHDCGEIGGLAQSRRRFLLMARHIEKIPPFLYQPESKPLRAVGDVLGRMLLPGDLRAGPMHRVPKLQWKTWTRLALVEAGSDWRSLNRLTVVDGKLRDYLIVPESAMRGRGLSEQALDVGDPRYPDDRHRGPLGVVPWSDTAGTVAGASRATNGAFNVADPRFDHSDRWNAGQQYGVHRWDESCGTVTGQASPGQGRFSVADPRHAGAPKHSNEFRVMPWNGPAGVVTGAHGSGQCISDPRASGERHANVFRVVRWSEPSGTVTSDFKPTSGGGVADPRSDLFGKYEVTGWDQSARTVIGGSTTGQGAYAVADPRPPQRPLFTKYPVTPWDTRAGTVIGGDDAGAYAVADPRPGMGKDRGGQYVTAGHYGVVPWRATSGTVPSSACHDNGAWSVADPRDGMGTSPEPVEGSDALPPSMPSEKESLVAIIRAEDGTWHRPFTTLELAALQSLYDPEEWREVEALNAWHQGRLVGPDGGRARHFAMDGQSDTAYRERIGDMIPPAAARQVANVIGETYLLALSGETFVLSARPLWVRSLARALTLPAESLR